MAEGPLRLKKIMEHFLTAATEDKENVHKAITNQAEKLDSVARSQDKAIEKLADVLGQQQGHTALLSVVLQKYVEGGDSI
ncbi:hypothetical protein NDU88_010153 [Pleurodeles waltl]|uniref:Uncharacterized protein n=1 Tax=Pleurodeles waltl TaxID=8319 RepID=A0AAV7RY59_PLEWA|nr:hypothetical protein NDU88_010153 [Pleurodeles waltl]